MIHELTNSNDWRKCDALAAATTNAATNLHENDTYAYGLRTGKATDNRKRKTRHTTDTRHQHPKNIYHTWIRPTNDQLLLNWKTHKSKPRRPNTRPVETRPPSSRSMQCCSKLNQLLISLTICKYFFFTVTCFYSCKCFYEMKKNRKFCHR